MIETINQPVELGYYNIHNENEESAKILIFRLKKRFFWCILEHIAARESPKLTYPAFELTKEKRQ